MQKLFSSGFIQKILVCKKKVKQKYFGHRGKRRSNFILKNRDPILGMHDIITSLNTIGNVILTTILLEVIIGYSILTHFFSN